MRARSSTTIKVLVADYSFATAKAVAWLIRSSDELECVGYSSDLDEIEEEISSGNVDVLLIDPGERSDTWLPRVIEASERLENFGIVLFLTQPTKIDDAIKSKIDGFLFKGCALDELVRTVQAVGEGRSK